MHISVNFLLLITTTSLVLVNARKLTSYDNNNNASFSVELIHRDAPKGSGRGRLSLGSVSSHHRISLSSEFYEGKNVQTEIVPDGGAYDMKFKIGTPPVEFTAIADTGSDLVWIQCSPCESCFPHSPFFDPTQSSTFHTVPCSSQVCNPNEPGLRGTGCAQNGGASNDGSCVYETGYGGGTQTAGILSTETIALFSSDGSPTSFPSFIFGCGVDQDGQPGDLGTQGNGIAGLGDGPLSLVSQLGTNFNYKFSYCLTPLASGVNSKLKFGPDVSGPGVVSTPFTKQNNNPTFYHLTLDGISVGGSSVPIANYNDVVIDSGTTLTYLPSSIYAGIRDAMKGAIGLTTVPDPEQMFDPCYEGQVSPPDVVFQFQGANVVLKPQNTFKTNGGVTCLTMVPTQNTFIFGNIAQNNFQVGYDLQAKRVSFAPADCTKF